MAAALSLAVIYNQTNIVEALIDYVHPSVGQPSLPLSRTLLHLAVRNGNLTVARALLKAGADPNATTDDGLSCLHVAVGSRSSAMVELLLESGADVNPARKFDGRTPLRMAVEQQCEDIVEVLLDRGAKLDEQSVEGYSVLQLAVCHRSERIADALVRRAEPSQVNARRPTDGKSALHLAIESGHPGVVRQLVRKGAHAEDEAGADGCTATPLTLAVLCGDEATVALLLRRGARGLARDCLHRAVRQRSRGIAELLLGQRVLPVDGLVAGETALQLAADLGYRDMMRVCLAHGASLDGLRARSLALLRDAVKANDVRLVELLLARGAPVNGLLGKRNRTRVFDLAVGARRVGMTRLLLKHGAWINMRAAAEDAAFALKYAVLGLAEGYKIQRENRKLVRTDQRWADFYEACRQELKLAKGEEIAAEQQLTIFDLLTGDADVLVACAADRRFVEAFPDSGYRQRYPIYADAIALNYARGIARRTYLRQAAMILEKRIGVSPDSAEYVVKLMSEAELRDFVRAFCDSEQDEHHCLPETIVRF
ncbi:putative ankyrin repeat protein RF_0381 [Phymastichus coffea]|uniref:putative ankyrin repeat protein RF_0381 n=1 Tax=Phymastichus coffea TaxID=108790 RepID=UPI00273B49DC|nr:putative ankyrin repeat protein RF_0381 [Phymastichus coffea]